MGADRISIGSTQHGSASKKVELRACARCSLITTKLTSLSKRKKRNTFSHTMLKFCNPAGNYAKGECCSCRHSFQQQRVSEALVINTSAKSDEAFQGATSETCLSVHFYINPEIFMLFVKYSCELVCKLVPRGRKSEHTQQTPRTVCAVMLLVYRSLNGTLMTWPIKMNSPQPV